MIDRNLWARFNTLLYEGKATSWIWYEGVTDFSHTLLIHVYQKSANKLDISTMQKSVLINANNGQAISH